MTDKNRQKTVPHHPITPLLNKNGYPLHEDGISFGNEGLCHGLTKREYAAIKAMQGLLANDYNSQTRVDVLASSSVMFADALLKELEK